MACIDNARIKEAKEQLEKITSDKELMYVIINQQMAEMDAASSLDRAINKGRAEGEAKGRAEGEVKGRTEGKIEIAKKMKEEGLSIEIIMKTTGLSKEEIEKL